MQQTVANPVWGRTVGAALAAAVAGWTAWRLPFFPAHWPLGLAVAAAAAAALRPRVGLALTLAVPVLPLGNVSLGLAVLYAAAAAAWLAAAWRDPRAGLLFAVGPLLAPFALLGLVPLALAGVRSTALRAAAAFAAVAAAGITAGIRHAPLPLTDARPPRSLGIAGSERPLAVAGAVWRVVAAHPTLLVEAAVLAAAAAVLPLVRARGLWTIALFGAALLAASVLAAPAVSATPLVVCVWATALALARTHVARARASQDRAAGDNLGLCSVRSSRRSSR